MPPPPPRSRWQRFSAGAVTLFHAYGNWLVGITWMRFALLSVLLLISAEILSKLPPFNLPIGSTEHVTVTPPFAAEAAEAAQGRQPGASPASSIEKKDTDGRDVTISIDKNGVRISPRGGRAPAAGGSASGLRRGIGSVGGSGLGRRGLARRRRRRDQAAAGRRQRGGARGGRGGARRPWSRRSASRSRRSRRPRPKPPRKRRAIGGDAGPAHPPHAHGRLRSPTSPSC